MKLLKTFLRATRSGLGIILLLSVQLAGCGGGGDKISPATTETVASSAPEITLQPGIQYVKPGQSATFTVVATGAGPLHYQWKKNGSTNVGGDSPSYITPVTKMENNGEKYRVLVSNAAGSVTSDEVTLTVNENDLPVTIQRQPQNITVTAGATATFAVVASGTGPLNYQWKKNGSKVGSNLAGYTTDVTTLADNGATYSVDVSNALNSVTSTSAKLTVNATTVAPTITTQPQSMTVTEGGTASFSVAAAGSSPLHYQWKKGDADVGADSASLVFLNALTSDAGSYTVQVSNSIGNVTSAAATLNVKAATTVSVGIRPASAILVTGATRTFTASVTGNSNTAVNWSATAGTITAGGVYTAPPAAGDYLVRATSQADSNAYSEATVKVILPDHQIRVLFLGNSFTNEHDLDAQVMGLAQAAGLNFYAEKYTIGGADLRDLWDEGKGLQKIQEGNWDYVVLQPFWHAYGEITKEEEKVYAENFDKEIKKIGALTAIYCTWAQGLGALGKPSDDNLWDYNKEENADLGNLWIAEQLKALPVKVGDAWQVSYLRHPSIPLYASDGSHPSNTGHYFTASLFFAALTGVSPVGNSYLPPPASNSSDADSGVVSTVNAAILQALAWELN